MLMRSKFLPWRPTVTLTGTAYYSVDCSGATGQIMSHRDEWDAVSDNSYLSVSCPCKHNISIEHRTRLRVVAMLIVQ